MLLIKKDYKEKYIFVNYIKYIGYFRRNSELQGYQLEILLKFLLYILYENLFCKYQIYEINKSERGYLTFE